jgi:hypothetical protein
MLLAEELALVAVDPETGRHRLGVRPDLNACLAGLLVAELLLDGVVAPGPKDKTVVSTDAPLPDDPALRAAAAVVATHGPKMKAILSHMDRGLTGQLGTGTWDTTLAGLERAGIVGPSGGGLRPRHDLLAPDVRQSLLERLQAAAAGDGPLEPRTALVLSLTGPAQLLEDVAPDRSGRRHARRRIDHALEDTDLEPIGATVRALRAEAAAIAATAASTGAVIGGSS